MYREVWLIAAIAVWSILKLMNHRVFMYQRTIRKFRLMGIELVNENNLYPISHGIMLLVSILRYAPLGCIFYFNIFAGVVCVFVGHLLTIFAPEQDDLKNLRKALDTLEYKYSKGLIGYSEFFLDSLAIEKLIGASKGEFDEEGYPSRKTKYEQGEELTFIMNEVEQKAEIRGITTDGDYEVQIERKVEGIDKNIVDIYTEEEIDKYTQIADRKKTFDRLKDLGYLDQKGYPTQDCKFPASESRGDII